MTVDAHTWLPANSFCLERVQEVLRDVLEDWARCWLGDAVATLTRVEDSETSRRIPVGAEIRSSRNAVNLVMGGPGKRALIEAALALDLAGVAPTEGDHRLLTLFATRLVDDLAERISAFANGKTTSDGNPMTLTLAIGGKDMLSCSLPKSAVAQALKTRIDRAADGCEPISRRRALASTQVDVEAVLGQVSLSVEELKGIAVGDVLVLDRVVTAPVDLRLSEGGRHLLSGRLQSDRGHVAVQL